MDNETAYFRDNLPAVLVKVSQKPLQRAGGGWGGGEGEEKRGALVRITGLFKGTSSMPAMQLSTLTNDLP